MSFYLIILDTKRDSMGAIYGGFATKLSVEFGPMWAAQKRGSSTKNQPSILEMAVLLSAMRVQDYVQFI
jgi:hypothetical protein